MRGGVYGFGTHFVESKVLGISKERPWKLPRVPGVRSRGLYHKECETETRASGSANGYLERGMVLLALLTGNDPATSSNSYDICHTIFGGMVVGIVVQFG